MLFVCAGLWVTLPFHISNSQNPKDISQTHRNFDGKCVKTISNYSQIVLKPSWHLTFKVLDLFNVWKRRTLDRRYDLWWTTSRAVCFTTLIPNVPWSLSGPQKHGTKWKESMNPRYRKQLLFTARSNRALNIESTSSLYCRVQTQFSRNVEGRH